MTTELRPLTLGEILDRTAELYRGNFPLFTGIAAIFATVMLLAQVIVLGILQFLGYPNVPGNLQWTVAALSVFEWSVWVLVAGLAIAAFNRTVAWVYLGQPATIRAAAASVRPHLGRYLWVMTSTGGRAWGPLAAIYIVVFAILFAVMPQGWLTNPSVMQQPHALQPDKVLQVAAAFLVIGPLYLVAIIYGVMMWLRYSLAMPACVVEGAPAGLAIRRGIALSKGARGRLFVLWLMVYVIRFILGLVFGVPIIFFSAKHLGQPLPIWLIALSALAGFLINTFIGPIYSTGLTLFYYDQRVRKEGFDVEWMMRAAGLSPQTELPAAAEPETEPPRI